MLVRERVGNVCEKCFRPAGVIQLECAHVQGRRYKRTRWHPRGARSLCHAHHRYFTENPIEFHNWLLTIGYTAAELEKIIRLSHSVWKTSKVKLDEIYGNLKESYKLMMAQRALCSRDLLDFPSPYPEDR